MNGEEYRRGVAYLIRAREADGSWHVRSRAFGFQPYFESGFPHGHDQWISIAATAWSAMALMPAAEAGHRQINLSVRETPPAQIRIAPLNVDAARQTASSAYGTHGERECQMSMHKTSSRQNMA